MKDKEWLKEEIEKIDVETSENFPHYDVISKNVVLYAINQLDEPETLSLDWIDENVVEGDFRGEQQFWYGRFIEEEKVRNLLVPKQEEPEKVVLPDFVFNHLEKYKDKGLSLWMALGNGVDYELTDWLTGPNQEVYARAWLAYPNIEVEKEQKYILSINITDKASKTNYETFLNKRGIFHSMDNESFNSEEFNWSEEEIKDLESGEILFEHFATKVEELEE